MVFLVETQEPLNTSRTWAVSVSLATLLKRSCRHEYEDFDVRYAVLAYDTGNIRLVQGFTSVCTEHQLGRVFATPLAPTAAEGLAGSAAAVEATGAVESKINAQAKPIQALTNATQQEELDFVTAERTLWVIASVLDRRDAPPHLEHRPNADLHVVAVTDLEEVDGGSRDHDETKDVVDSAEGSWLPLIARVLDHVGNHSRVAVHVFLDDRNAASTAVFAKPALSAGARYADCTHLSRASALKSLIRAGSAQANTLQAHLLSRGLYADVHDLGDLTRADCVASLNPALWSSLGLNPSHPDLCAHGDGPCPNGTFCSPLHGCSQLRADNKSTTESPEKVTLAPFGVNHADLAAVLASSNSTNNTVVPAPSGPLSILEEPLPTSPRAHLSDQVVGEPVTWMWEPDRPFIEEVVRGGVPVVIRNSVVEAWPARRLWNMTYLAGKMDAEVLSSVKCSNSYLTFDPDKRAPLKLDLPLPFSVVHMSTAIFFECVLHPSTCPDGMVGHYYFSQVPETLRPDLQPDRKLYLSAKDHESKKQFLWISSEGMITHGHFDQDYNVFVQLVGEKRFTLWSPSQHDLLYPYPRVHPMWHKSRINFGAPDLARFPQFAKARAQQVVLSPGTALFVPPYTWHYVETLSPSVSLSTWSHDYFLYDHMDAVYRHDHNFDLIKHPKGQMFVLRLYLDMMIHHLYGFNQTTPFFVRLLATRYSGLEHLFPPAGPRDRDICRAHVKGKIPTCHHVHGYAKLDTSIVGEHFGALPSEVRDILFQDYVEEITAQVVGVKKMMAFFRYCFLGQEYYVTEMKDKEHSLWDHV